MSQQPHAQNVDLDKLEALCEECRHAIDTQQDSVMQQTMRQVCEKCREVRDHLPELVDLRKKIHEMSEKYSG